MAISFLEDYAKKTNPQIKSFLDQKILEALDIGFVPKETIARFKEMALLGKKVRGALMVLSYLICGGKKKEEIYNSSIFYEIFATGILVQDDVMDNSDKRRGLVSLHRQFEKMGNSIKYGESLAVCIADFAYFIAYEKLLNSKFPKKNIIEAAKIFTKYSARLALGQILDLSNNSVKKIKEEAVLKTLKIKSAEYSMISPLLIGAALAGMKKKGKLTSLYNFGLNAGLAFQIQDDILGMFGEEKTLGKPVGSDLKEGKNTLLIMHLREHGSKEQIKFLERVLGNKEIDNNHILKMRKILEDSRSLYYVKNLGEKYLEKGLLSIPLITADKHYQDLLKSFLNLVAKRKN